MGEAAGVVVLEELERAQARGAKIYAELIGYGMSADAAHMTEPDPTGQSPARAMRMALADAGIDPTEIGYVNAHATSTPLGDAAETKVIKVALGEEHARRTPVSSTKGATGHCFGAAGAIEAIFTIARPPRPRSCRRRSTSRTPIPTAISTTSRTWRARCPSSHAAVSNSFGFGGHNATIVLRRWADDEAGSCAGCATAGRRSTATGTLIDWNGGIRAELERRASATTTTRPSRRAARAATTSSSAELERDGDAQLPRGDDRGDAPARRARRARRAGSPTRCRPGSRSPRCARRSTEARERGWRLAILSNSDPDLIEASKERIGVPFDETVVASEIRSYKPALMHWLEFYARTLRRPAPPRPRRREHLPRHRAGGEAPASRASGSTGSSEHPRSPTPTRELAGPDRARRHARRARCPSLSDAVAATARGAGAV